MLNQVTLVGRLGADPEVKETTSGTHFCNLSVATNERYKQGEEYKEKTQWHKVVVFNPNLAQSIGKYYKKGDTITIQGQIEYRSYDNGDGTKYVTEIVVPRFNGSVKLIPQGTGKSAAKPNSKPVTDSNGQEEPYVPF